MAMMMTGRVLLVCALCVLWCGVCGGGCDGGETAVPRSGAGGPPPGSAELGTPLQDTQELNVESPDINGKVPSQSSPRIEKADDEDSDDEDREGKDKKDEKEKNKVQPEKDEGKKKEGPPPPPPPPPPPAPPPPPGGPAPSSTAVEGGPTAEKENLQKVTKKDSEAPEAPSGDATQGQHSHDTDTEDSTKNAATGSPAEPTTTLSTSASGSGDHVQNKADEDDAQSSEEQHDSVETGNANDVPTLSEEAPQTAETITAARINVTTTPGDSDGSTAVSHTTSPLLLLLVVACAAAAAVMAA
ncbi:Mucin-associated surface protein (MASP) [Trypanosoma cruzi]|uniref:Mucin-associated surface protein (MASP), putative n=2 Tax=Trypanosoma cruzi TaxID=5693 RepID=Q4DNA6_TRYCC|nr:mucin-associated surface protein (MASP), putative [Trypanosoma cruzi]EAN93999.1 mucin-associated surface protein (MASP), putative [Trypanosoma cruzi]PWV10264.1 Mucin-associated surface protein (MASP) [Trypanosoma cruzi]RNC56502.1 mucin-associated surface protein (MASP) [Trypanosoma cruzi]|eukprot:XP_815850.1 mucin-associated surface protein (MASP) [Trypanosoma cruzi strain CL Brener]